MAEISTQLGESVISQFMEDGVVCPAILQKGLFTTSAVDNIDHNPSATTATISCHGTDISVNDMLTMTLSQHLTLHWLNLQIEATHTQGEGFER
jgi:hypothetical protein